MGAVAGTGHLYSHIINTKSRDGKRSRHCFIGFNTLTPPIPSRWALGLLLMNEVLKLERLHAVGDPTGGRWPSRDLSLVWALLPPHPLGSEGAVSHGIHYYQVREPGECVGQLHPSPS